jgi:hypothetical protein
MAVMNPRSSCDKVRFDREPNGEVDWIFRTME